MFKGPVTGNIPQVLDNGEVTCGTHVAAGQLALALTPKWQTWPSTESSQSLLLWPAQTGKWLRTEAALQRCRAC